MAKNILVVEDDKNVANLVTTYFENEKWNVKIYQNPLVSFIWLGVILMIFSGLKGIRN